MRQCLDSIIMQTYFDIEIICVDDGSKDESLLILQQYAEIDKRIKVFTKKNEGKGAASARNLGLDNATGEYILFLDSDDFFEKNMIELLVIKALDTRADLIVFDANVFDDRSSTIVSRYKGIHLKYAPPKEVFTYSEIKDYIFQMADHVVWNKMFKLSLLRENNLYFEPIPICDDQFVPVLSLIYAKKISVVNKAFVNYRISTGVGQWDSRISYPEVAYKASYSIVDRLKSIGKYNEVKKSYVNIVLGVMRLIFDEVDEYIVLEQLLHKYKTDVFVMLEATDLSKDFFYDSRLGDWYELVNNNTLKDILFKSARAYNANMTTAILRFQVPYEKIEKGSKIVLVGKGMVGRYWYAQLLLSNHAEVVQWVENEEEILRDFCDCPKIYAK